MPKTTVATLLAAKGSRKWVQVHVDRAAEAAAVAAEAAHPAVRAPGATP